MRTTLPATPPQSRDWSTATLTISKCTRSIFATYAVFTRRCFARSQQYGNTRNTIFYYMRYQVHYRGC